MISSATGSGTIVVLPNAGNVLRGSGNAALDIYGVGPGGITIKGNGVTVEGCLFDPYNPWGYYDGYGYGYGTPYHYGINLWDGTLVVEDLNFQSFTNWQGGAVGAYGNGSGSGSGSTSYTLKRCTITNCSAGDNGGAIRADGAVLTLEDCVVSSCSCYDKGGALSAESSTVTIRRCQFANNTASGDGGAVHTNACTGLI